MEEQQDYQSFDHGPYYDMGHHQPEGYPMYMPDAYQGATYAGQPMVHHNPPMPPMGFNPSMVPNMPQNHYAVSPGPAEYAEEDGSKSVQSHSIDMQYVNQYQMPRHPQNTGTGEEYHHYGNGY